MKNLRNKVQLIGNLGMDPEVKSLSNGNKVVNFTLATSEYFKDAQGNRKQDTQWHRVVAWGQLANIIESYVHKGSQVAVEGKLVHRSFETKTGERKFVTEIVANDLVMLNKNEENR